MGYDRLQERGPNQIISSLSQQNEFSSGAGCDQAAPSAPALGSCGASGGQMGVTVVPSCSSSRHTAHWQSALSVSSTSKVTT